MASGVDNKSEAHLARPAHFNSLKHYCHIQAAAPPCVPSARCCGGGPSFDISAARRDCTVKLIVISCWPC